MRPEEDDDFNIRNPEDIIQAQLESSRTLTVLLVAIASISRLVGGIGIMTVMLVSVTERTREIGVRVAVGVFFGYYLARKASLLDPIDALRYE